MKGYRFMKKTRLILDMAVMLCSTVLCFGTKLLFHACPQKEDGSWMSCHWAEQAVFGIGIVMLLLSILMTFCFKDERTKSGIAVSIAVISAFSAMLPNHLIKLCMMANMRCHSVMKPAVLIISIVLLFLSVASLILHRKEGRA